MRLSAYLGLDVRLQARYRLYVFGIAVAMLLGALAKASIPARAWPEAWAALAVLGMGGTTFLFGAGMLLLEGREKTLLALRVTPSSPLPYLGAKVLSLGGFATLESAILFGLLSGPSVSLLPAALGLAFLAAVTTLVGVGLAAGHDAITRFLFPGGALVAVVLQLPLVPFLGWGPHWPWVWIPSYPAAALLWGAVTDWSWSHLVGMTALGTLQSAAVGAFAVWRLERGLGWLR